MKLFVYKPIVFSLLLGIGAAEGCSHEIASQSESEDVGTVGLQLTLPGSENVSTLSWQVLSDTTVVRSGQVSVTSGQTASFLVGGLFAGPYTINLDGSSTDGAVTCSGSGAFTVAARQTTQASLNLQCFAGVADAGSVAVTAALNPCATWQSISASSTEVAVGSTVTLSATATASNPGAITYQWSAPNGTLGSPTAATTSFTSSVSGPVAVTLLVGDGPVASGTTCNPSLDTTSVTVTFDPTADDGPLTEPAISGSSLVSIVDPLAGRDNFFYIGADNQVYGLSSSSGLAWSPENVNALVNPAAPPASGTVLSGHLENSCGRSGGGGNVGSSGAGASGSPNGGAAPTNQSEEVFYLGSDQHVHELWRWSAQASFDGWHHTDVSSAGAAMTLANPASSLAVIADPFANADVVFYEGVDGHLYALSFTCASSQWTTLDLTAKYAAPSAAGGSAFAAQLDDVTPSTPSEQLF